MKTIGKKIEEDQPSQPTPSAAAEHAEPAGDTPGDVLGSLSGAGKGASAVKKETEPVKKSHRKADDSASKPPVEEPLKLPKGAIVILRRSGGLRFTSREVTVHRDGQITYSDATSRAIGKAGARRQSANSQPPPRKLTKRELSQLRIMLSKSDLASANASATAGRKRQNPDAYAYEIVARAGRKVHSVEVFDGRIPPSLEPLIRELSSYLSEG